MNEEKTPKGFVELKIQIHKETGQIYYVGGDQEISDGDFDQPYIGQEILEKRFKECNNDGPIFTVTTLQPALFSKSRTVGYYKTLEEAQNAVEENHGDIAENSYYLYCVIESHNPGIYNYNELFSWWFKYNHKKKKYIKCQKPENFRRTVSFAMG